MSVILPFGLHFVMNSSNYIFWFHYTAFLPFNFCGYPISDCVLERLAWFVKNSPAQKLTSSWVLTVATNRYRFHPEHTKGLIPLKVSQPSTSNALHHGLSRAHYLSHII